MIAVRYLSLIPYGTRTRGLLLRRQSLYPTELRGRVCVLVCPAGFEPAPSKGTELKSVALDHSAIDTLTGNIWLQMLKMLCEMLAVCCLGFCQFYGPT